MKTNLRLAVALLLTGVLALLTPPGNAAANGKKEEAVASIERHRAELIKLRDFLGLPNVEAARLLGVPERTAKRTWAFARAWLYREIRQKL